MVSALRFVNALSTNLDVTVVRGGKRYYIDFVRGKVNTPMKELGPAPEHEQGTKVHFQPDPDIFTETTTFDDKVLTTRDS